MRQRLAADPLLARYEPVLKRRLAALAKLRGELLDPAPVLTPVPVLTQAPAKPKTGKQTARKSSARKPVVNPPKTLIEFASGHLRFGWHRDKKHWVLREWAPYADAMWLVGPFSGWRVLPEFQLQRDESGVFELRIAEALLPHGTRHRLKVRWPDGSGERLPAWSHRVVQDAKTGSWDAELWAPATSYQWQHQAPPPLDGPLLIYETHIGMAQEAARVGSYEEFRTEVLPRIRDAGYDTLQIMGLAEHPYYGSFGYQISSFFAASSRFGTPDELKALIDAAHGLGLRVLMDIVHSHCARNEVEGISRQDGSDSQYVLPGARGEHPAWGSRCFNYEKREVLEFLLSNCRYWLDEFHVDGFRFDGVTSMLYTHHGLDHKFTSFGEYFGDAVDESALLYLTLANELIHELSPHAITIAEDVSGMPGLAAPIAEGGAGFDYRFAMGVADEWIKLIKETPDEKWPMGHLWYELTNRRRDEKTISYAESHDQALVGDQTIIFRLIGERMYDSMSILKSDIGVDRGIALHKLIRLATIATAGDGYLNFMGNEFGHPEWIDFPREGNKWSYDYARRQWSLAEEKLLRYHHLQEFDRAMVALAREQGLPGGDDEYLLHVDEIGKVIAFLRADLVFVLNFHWSKSHTAYPVPTAPGKYQMVLGTDDVKFGGHDRQDAGVQHETVTDRIHRHFLYLYLPARTGMVLRAIQ